MAVRKRIDIDTIMLAATEIADKNGIEAITIASLAKKLQIKPPSLYNHIEGLEGVRNKLAIYGLNELYHYLVSAVIGRAGDDAVFSLGKAYVSFAEQHPGLYDATLLTSNLNDGEIHQAGQQIVDLVVRILNYYELKESEIVHAVRGFRSLLHGFASLKNKGGFGLPVNVDESFKIMLNTFLKGIKT